MITEEDRFRDHLKKKGLKFTSERKLILKEVFSSHKHFDVEELFGRLRKKDRAISRATIYRTLPLLIESGLIREALRCRDRFYYEHVFGHPHHDHLLCIGCGKVIEFRDERLEKLQNEVCKKYGFELIEHRLGIKGYCKKCQKKISKST
ncbi:MAG: transcriptional repressor [Candidatus Omnitrophota bacterium]|nr:MAG: transcriptional repressor [Candidatus Omnitrophota bacterium]